MKATLTLWLCAMTCALALTAQDQAAPDSWNPQAQPRIQLTNYSPPVAIISPDAFETAALKWIAVLTTVSTAALGLLAVLWSKVKELKARQDRQGMKTGSLETRLTAVALATPQGLDALQQHRLAPDITGQVSTPDQVRRVIAEEKRPGGSLSGGAALIIAALFLQACATHTGDAGKDARGRTTNAALSYAGQFLGRAAVSALMTVASDELGGRKADYGSAAAAGLWASVDAASTAQAVKGIVAAYSGEKAPATAQTSATVFQRAVAAGQDARKVIAAIATVVSTASGAPPKSVQ